MSGFRGGGGGWEGFGQYMRDKTKKLAGQFDDRYNKKSQVFEGKTFWSTGRLLDFEFDLKQLITENGGVYEQYGLRNVSHIIASNLALSNQNWKKLLGGKFTSKSYCVVKPQWIVDSLKAGKCLPEGEYLPDCIKIKGTITDFLNDQPRDLVMHSDTRTESYADSSHPNSMNIIKLVIENPRDGLSLAEELCFELLSSNYQFAKRGYVTINVSGTINTLVLDLKQSCVSDALISELSKQDWTGVDFAALCLFKCEVGDSPVDILPTQKEIHPSSIAARITNLTSALVGADEDTLEAVVVRVLYEAAISCFI